MEALEQRILDTIEVHGCMSAAQILLCNRDDPATVYRAIASLIAHGRLYTYDCEEGAVYTHKLK